MLVKRVWFTKDNFKSLMKANLSSAISKFSYYNNKVEATSKYNEVDVNKISYICLIHSFLFIFLF